MAPRMSFAVAVAAFVLAIISGGRAFAEDPAKPPPAGQGAPSPAAPPAEKAAEKPAAPAAKPEGKPAAEEKKDAAPPVPAAQPSAPQSQPEPRKKPVEGPTLLVFDLIGEKNIEKGAANLLTEVVMDRFALSKKYAVVGQKDLDKMLFWEQNKQLRGCTDTACLVQIAGAMGAAFYVEGSIGVMGEQYIVTLKLIDAASVRVVDRVTERVRKDEGVAVKAVEHMADVLAGMKAKEAFKEDAPAPKPEPGSAGVAKTVEVEKPFPWRTAGIVSTFAGVGVAATGAVFTYLASAAAEDFKNAKDQTSMQDARDRNGLYNSVGVGLYAVGGTLAVTGVCLWIFADGDPSDKTAMMPFYDGRAGGVMIQGGW